jgi:hypothetical protein
VCGVMSIRKVEGKWRTQVVARVTHQVAINVDVRLFGNCVDSKSSDNCASSTPRYKNKTSAAPNRQETTTFPRMQENVRVVQQSPPKIATQKSQANPFL